MSTRGERRKKLRQAHASKQTSSAARSTAPRLFVESYSRRPPGDPTIADYCAEPRSEVDPQLGFNS